MNTIQAPKGGQLHTLSDKFYEGGQFMPEPDKMAGVKRSARKAAVKFEVFTNPSIGVPLNGKIPVCVMVDGRTKVIISVSTQEEAEVARDVFRKAIEERLGGAPLKW